MNRHSYPFNIISTVTETGKAAKVPVEPVTPTIPTYTEPRLREKIATRVRGALRRGRTESAALK